MSMLSSIQRTRLFTPSYSSIQPTIDKPHLCLYKMHSNVLTLLAFWLYAMSAGTSVAFP